MQELFAAFCDQCFLDRGRPGPESLDLSPVLLDRRIQFLVLAMLEQVGEDPQDSSCAAVEGQLRANSLALAYAA